MIICYISSKKLGGGKRRMRLFQKSLNFGFDEQTSNKAANNSSKKKRGGDWCWNFHYFQKPNKYSAIFEH